MVFINEMHMIMETAEKDLCLIAYLCTKCSSNVPIMIGGRWNLILKKRLWQIETERIYLKYMKQERCFALPFQLDLCKILKITEFVTLMPF